MQAMQITLDLTTMRPETLAAIVADLTHQIDAQDWTAGDAADTADAILIHLFAIPGLDHDSVDDMLADAGAEEGVLDRLTTALIIQGRIS